MTTLAAPSKRASFTPTQWQEVLKHLADQVTGWAREAGWTTRMTEAQVFEGYFYPPTLDIEAPEGHLKMELPPQESGPESARIPHPKLYAWPGLYRVRLRYRGEQFGWEIWTDSGIPLHEDWNAKTFTTVAHDLMVAD